MSITPQLRPKAQLRESYPIAVRARRAVELPAIEGCSGPETLGWPGRILVVRIEARHTVDELMFPRADVPVPIGVRTKVAVVTLATIEVEDTERRAVALVTT